MGILSASERFIAAHNFERQPNTKVDLRDFEPQCNY